MEVNAVIWELEIVGEFSFISATREKWQENGYYAYAIYTEQGD
jgi:hypothetical protein